MKIISFSTVEILPALLNKRKTQTIRPAWKAWKLPLGAFTTKQDIEPIMKEPRFKVGEKVKMMHPIYYIAIWGYFVFLALIAIICFGVGGLVILGGLLW